MHLFSILCWEVRAWGLYLPAFLSVDATHMPISLPDESDGAVWRGSVPRRLEYFPPDPACGIKDRRGGEGRGAGRWKRWQCQRAGAHLAILPNAILFSPSLHHLLLC
ncbi:hypothetical protein SKAU_G00310420 [Synaphobranchus kaupii]|uniref:Secreted protein n=1 Tax=Synaphobranchus kaupii TaxID=118154 RepID=A0A9Q1ERR3_SYNKA|nr:hypothetical protein SKAU_G00310420 [Synaphobranchus kaupii]